MTARKMNLLDLCHLLFPAKTTLACSPLPSPLYLMCMLAKTEDMPGIAHGS